jgi:hypothetical protein
MTNQNFSYHVDLALVIDGTASMTPVIDQVKAAALQFESRLQKVLHDHGKRVDRIRVRVIVFRDLFDNGNESLVASDFFVLPDEASALAQWVGRIRVLGNTTDTESGLAGLAVAINSKWTSDGDRRRHVIVLWTDSDPHLPEAEDGRAPAAFRSQVARSFDHLTDMWGSSQLVSTSSRRLVLFAPEIGKWPEIGDNWDNVVLYPSQAGAGLEEFDFNEILQMISNSI